MSSGERTPGESPAPRWLAFVATLPVDDAGARMKVLRTLETLGAAVLRDGVYLLPDSQPSRHGLTRLGQYVVRTGGTADILAVKSLDEAQAKRFRGLFDRAQKYVDLIKTVESLRAGFGIADPSAINKVLAKLRRDFEAIAALDFFDSPFKSRAETALVEMEQRVRDLLFPDSESGDAEAVARPTKSNRQFFRRAWATRTPLHADRLASAWLIRRFIDAEATMIWLDKGQDCPATAVSFGFDGATFRNTRTRVTYEELLARFRLDGNPALARIGGVVHALDANDGRLPEAAGVETLLAGARRRATTDDELLAESEKTFDLLYEAYLELPQAK